MPNYVIGVDNGGTFIKAAIYDESGQMVGLAKEPGQVINNSPGLVERDQQLLWDANCACIKNAIQNSGIDPKNILALGFAGQGKGVYMLGERGEIIRNALTSSDTRSWRYVERWEKDGTAEKVFGMTFQKVSESQPVSILAWMKDHEPETYRKIRWVLSMKDYLVYRMTGEVVSDYCNQSGSNYINLATNEYDPEILRLLGIPEISRALPPLMNAADVCGLVTPEAAEATGCVPGTKIITGMFDVDATAIASGLVDEDRLCVIAGTHGVNVYLAREPVKNKTIMLNSLYCIPGYYLIEEGASTSAGILEWVLKILYNAELRQTSTGCNNLYAELNETVSRIEPENCDVLFLPFLNGSRDNVLAKGVWLGMSAADGRDQFLRSVYEGVVFAHRNLVDRLLLNRKKPKAIRLSGGAANSDVWVQIFADALNIPIEIVDGKELGTRGVAIAAAIASGLYQDFSSAVAKNTNVRKTVQPRPDKVLVYDAKYRRFTAAMQQMDPLWTKP